MIVHRYYTFGPTAGLLFISQIYGAYVLVAIWRKARKDLRLERLKQMSGAGADESDMDSMDGDGDREKAENGHAVRRERRKSALVVMGDRVMSLGGQRKKKEKPEENGNGLDHAERGENGAPQTRPRTDSGASLCGICVVVSGRACSCSCAVSCHVMSCCVLFVMRAHMSSQPSSASSTWCESEGRASATR